MESISEKAAFLKEGLTKKLAEMNPGTEPLWGKMNMPQMTEHLIDTLRVSNGKLELAIETPEEQLPKMQAFIQSEKPFRENTVNNLMPEIPLPPKHANVQDAIKELQEEIDHFFLVFKEPGKTTVSPFFGALNYELQVQLLYKHVTHHLRQFGAA